MTYYTCHGNSEKPLQITFLTGDTFPLDLKTKPFSSFEPVKVGFFQPEHKEDVADILHSPTYLFSDKLKTVLDEFHEKQSQKTQFLALEQGLPLPLIPPLPWCCLQVLPTAEDWEEYPRYWMLDMMERPCCHEDSRFFPNQTLEHLILDQKKIPSAPCFKVGGILETRVIFTQELAEAVLQSCPFAVTVEKVEVK